MDGIPGTGCYTHYHLMFFHLLHPYRAAIALRHRGFWACVWCWSCFPQRGSCDAPCGSSPSSPYTSYVQEVRVDAPLRISATVPISYAGRRLWRHCTDVWSTICVIHHWEEGSLVPITERSLSSGADAASPLLQAHTRGVGGMYLYVPQLEWAVHMASPLLGFLHTSCFLLAGIAWRAALGKILGD